MTALNLADPPEIANGGQSKLGAGRAAVFPTLVPPFTLVTGFVFLGNIPSVLQVIGLAMVLIGFRLTQKS